MPSSHSGPHASGLSLSLTPLERTVVALGLYDPLSSVSPPRRRWLRSDDPQRSRFGLANTRLEKLRRFVVLRRHGRSTDESAEATGLLAVGFSSEQIREAKMMISDGRDA